MVDAALPAPGVPGARASGRAGARSKPRGPRPITAPVTALESTLVLLLIAVTGNPVLSNPAFAPLCYVLLIGLGLCLPRARNSRPFWRHYGWLAAGFVVVFAAHLLTLGQVSAPGAAHFLVKILVGGWVIDRLGLRFARVFFRATYLLCLSSLLFYGLLLLLGPEQFPGPLGQEFTGQENVKSIGVFTVHTSIEWWRNSSMLWEPGAFQGIINLALFLAPNRLLLQRRSRWPVLVMLLALLTTFSTTGYLVLFLVALFKLGAARLSGLAKAALLVLVLAVGVVTFIEADFLGEKIVEQFLAAQTYDGFMPDRFGALLFDLQYIDKHPLFGNGLIEATRYADHPQLHGEPLGHGNGLSNFIATFGLAGMAMYALAILRSGFGRDQAGRGPRWALVLLVSMLSVGEQFLNTPLFLGLPFIALAALPPPRRRRRPGRRPQPAGAAVPAGARAAKDAAAPEAGAPAAG